MNLLAITQRVTIDSHTQEKRDALDQRWAIYLQKCGFIPLILPNNKASALSLIQQVSVQGILLSGGNDLVQYGGDAPERDELEFALIEYALANNIAMLGVCRGMQLIQAFFKHRLERISNHVSCQHEINFMGMSIRVNSYHNYACKKSIKPLLTMACSSDGVVEAVKHDSKKIWGIMWHPERNIVIEQSDISFVKTVFSGSEA